MMSVALAALGMLAPGGARAFLDTGTLLTNAASATYMGGGQGTSVTYSATAKILVANPAMFLQKDVNPTYLGTPGGYVTYILCFSNGGANSAFNFTITDKWPNNTTYTAASPASYTAWASGGGANQPIVSWSTAVLTGPWTAGQPAVNTAAPAGFHWVIPMMGVGYSGCITFALSVG